MAAGRARVLLLRPLLCLVHADVAEYLQGLQAESNLAPICFCQLFNAYLIMG